MFLAGLSSAKYTTLTIIVDSSHNHKPHDRPHELWAYRRRIRHVNARFKLHLERLSRLGTKIISEIIDKLQAILINNEFREVKVTPRDITNAQ